MLFEPVPLFIDLKQSSVAVTLLVGRQKWHLACEILL